MVTVYRVPQAATTTQVLAPACMVWTPAPVPAVYTTGVVPTVHGTTATTLVAPRSAQVVAPSLLSATTVAVPAGTPVQACRSPRKTQPQRPDDASSSPSAGSNVNVGGRHFERIRELGKGSFGVVWEVQECSRALPSSASRAMSKESPVAATGASVPLALKCSKPANQQMLEACLFEAEVLQRLAAALPAEVAERNRVPRHIAHCMSTSASASPTHAGAAIAALTGQTQVLVAMSKLEGKPLDQWLYGVDENKLKTVPLTQVLEGPFPEGVFASHSLADACATTCTLLQQMAPVFVPLDGIAYHRDVSAHNFLFREEAGNQHFALLDFGLAVRAPTWQHEYQTRNISGDPRYFTPAAWMLMVYGHKYLERHPDSSFLEQYKRRIDHYSMGLLSLEVLFSLWRGPEAETEALTGVEDEVAAASGRLTALAKVRGAWRALWEDAVTFFQLFHSKGFAATREALARSQGVSKYADKLRTLCSELRSVAAEIAADAPVATVLEIAAGLLDPRASLEWRDLPCLLRPREDPPAEGQATEVPREEVAAPQAAGEGRHGEAVEAAPVEPAPVAETVDAVASDSSSKPNAEANPPIQQVRKFSHRRNWTVDEAVSLTRGVREVGMGWGALPGMAEEGGS